MVRGSSLYRHEDEVFCFTRLSGLDQVAVALPVDGPRASWGGPREPLDSRDDGLSPCHRAPDGARVPHVTGDDLDEVASLVLGSVRVSCKDSHLEPTLRQQTHDFGSQCARPTGYQDHRAPLMRG